MSLQTIRLTTELQRYLTDVTLREPPLWGRLRAETAGLEYANMQIAPEQGQFMTLLAQLVGARRALEIGTFTGYSALCIARALPSDGQLICCDVSEEWTAIARRYWEEAGLADRIDLRIAPAQTTLAALLADGAAGTFDFAFIDADKEGYPAYYEQTLALLRPGGLVCVDNALADGRVLDPENPDHPTARYIDQVNRTAQADERVDMSLVPIGDGLLLARKR
jgi:predicted O-methyltransferase YrrM